MWGSNSRPWHHALPTELTDLTHLSKSNYYFLYPCDVYSRRKRTVEQFRKGYELFQLTKNIRKSTCKYLLGKHLIIFILSCYFLRIINATWRKNPMRVGGSVEAWNGTNSRDKLDWWRRANLPRTTGTENNKIFLFFCLILVEREQKADDEQSVMSVEHGSRKQWQKAAKSVTAQKQVSQSQLERYSQRYSLESQRNFSRIQVQLGRYHMFKPCCLLRLY